MDFFLGVQLHFTIDPYIMSCVWLDYMVKCFQCKNCVGSSPKTKKCVASFLVPGDKQGSDEHLLFQRRFRRAVFALSHNKKRAVLGVIPRRRFFAIRTFAFCYFSCYNGCRKEQEVMQIHLFPYTVRPCATGAEFLASVKFPYIPIKEELQKLRLIPHEFPLFFGILPKKRNKKSTNRYIGNAGKLILVCYN